MVYRHKFFSLNSDLQIVYNSDGGELRIAGDAYTLLFALCEKKTMSLEEVKKFLGVGKEYHGRKIKETIDKINHAVGIEIIVVEEIKWEFESETVISLKDEEMARESVQSVKQDQ
jgi:hypothetical protein